jgi:ribosomal-protein-alanine N-acetyltransferase
MNQSFPVLNTKRLQLRQLTAEDAPHIAALRSDDEVNKYIDRPRKTTLDEAKAFILKINNGFLNNENYYWAITEAASGELIGTICLWNFSNDRSCAEIGYELSRSWQGKGFMTESLDSVISLARDQLQLEKLEAFTHGKNQASRKLLVKFGFVFAPERFDLNNANNFIFELDL